MRRILLFVAWVSICVAVAAQQPAASQGTAVGTPYLVLEGNSMPKLEKEVNDAAAKGYRVVGAAQSAEIQRTLLMLRSGNGEERYAYRVMSLGSCDCPGANELPALEKALNEVAVEGFHLLPHGLLRLTEKPQGLVTFKSDEWFRNKRVTGEPLVAVMEKGPQSAKTDYRVLTFATVYEQKGSFFKKEITGRVADEDVDEQMAGAARAGYRIVQLLTRLPAPQKAKTLAERLLGKGPQGIPQEVIVVFEKEADAPTESGNILPRYHLVTAVDPETGLVRDRGVSVLNEALNASASAGYHLLAISRESYPVMTAIVERNAPTDPPGAYAVLSPVWKNMASDLAKASPAGWMLHARGAIDAPSILFPDRGYLLLVTDKVGKTGENWEYVVVDEVKANNLAKGLNQAAAGGYELVNVGASMGTVLAVLKRPKSTP